MHLNTERKTGAAFGSPFTFQKYGQSGIEVSELFAKTAESIDDICVIRSMHADVPNHEPSLMLMNCGEARQVRPSMGSWVTYGLGSENQNMPGFITMCPGGYPIQESQNWQSRLSARRLSGHLHRHEAHRDREADREHPQHLASRPRSSARSSICSSSSTPSISSKRQNDAQLEARIQSFELAYRMQMDAADAFDITTRAAAHPRAVRRRRAGPADAHRAAADRARRALRAGLARRRASRGTATTTSRRITAGSPANATRRSARCSRISSSAACSRTRSSSGAANSAARRRSNCPRRAPTTARSKRPRSQSPRLHHVDGGRRREGRLRPRRDR